MSYFSQHELDFIVTKNEIKAPYVFQVAIELPYIERNCFEEMTPVIVPAKTFLSQLV